MPTRASTISIDCGHFRLRPMKPSSTPARATDVPSKNLPDLAGDFSCSNAAVVVAVLQLAVTLKSAVAGPLPSTVMSGKEKQVLVMVTSDTAKLMVPAYPLVGVIVIVDVPTPF